jgi:hypothetical protein
VEELNSQEKNGLRSLSAKKGKVDNKHSTKGSFFYLKIS